MEKIKMTFDISRLDLIPDEEADPKEYTLNEFLAIAAAREVKNDDIVFAGTGLPMVGILAAQFLYAPKAVVVYEAGMFDGKAVHIPASVGDQRAAYMASQLGGLTETFGFYLQRGLVTLGFLGGAAIDKYGGINCTVIGDYHSPSRRLPGGGGNPDIGTLAKRTVFIMVQEKRRFVERNSYTTTPGWQVWDIERETWVPKSEVYPKQYANNGPSAVISNMAVFRFDDKGEMYLDTTHPGVTIEDVKKECDFELNVGMHKGVTKKPKYKELVLLRKIIDPGRLFIPAKLPKLRDDIEEICGGTC